MIFYNNNIVCSLTNQTPYNYHIWVVYPLQLNHPLHLILYRSLFQHRFPPPQSFVSSSSRSSGTLLKLLKSSNVTSDSSSSASMSSLLHSRSSSSWYTSTTSGTSRPISYYGSTVSSFICLPNMNHFFLLNYQHRASILINIVNQVENLFLLTCEYGRLICG